MFLNNFHRTCENKMLIAMQLFLIQQYFLSIAPKLTHTGPWPIATDPSKSYSA